MTLANVEHLVVLLLSITLLALLGVGAWVLVRLRRRWRRRRERAYAASVLRVPLRRATESLCSTLGSPSWWLVQRDRHGMWRSVATARRAVSIAERAGAPVGELPQLTRRLQHAAKGVDAALRASSGERRITRELCADRSRIEAAAIDIRAAAVASLDAMRVGVEPVISAIAVETAALAAGVESARSTARASY